MKKTTYLLIIFLLSLWSCGEKADENCCMNIERNFYFSLLNKEGKDLLDPKNRGSFNHKDIRVYKDATLKNDITNSFIIGDAKKSIVIPKNNEVFKHYAIALNAINGKFISKNIEQSTFYLKLSPTEIDTITTEVEHGKGYNIISKLIYNGKVQFENRNFGSWNKVIIR